MANYQIKDLYDQFTVKVNYEYLVANYQIKDLYDQFTVKVNYEYLMANYQIKDLYDQFTVKVNHDTYFSVNDSSLQCWRSLISDHEVCK